MKQTTGSSALPTLHRHRFMVYLAKIHKAVLQQMDDHLTLPEDTEARIPLRPINNCIGYPTFELSKYFNFNFNFTLFSTPFLVTIMLA